MIKFKLSIVLLLMTVGFSHLQAAKITAVKVGSKINVTIDGKYFTSYIFSSDEKYSFFHHVKSLHSGASVIPMRMEIMDLFHLHLLYTGPKTVRRLL